MKRVMSSSWWQLFWMVAIALLIQPVARDLPEITNAPGMSHALGTLAGVVIGGSGWYWYQKVK
jgi:hypothetical protein